MKRTTFMALSLSLSIAFIAVANEFIGNADSSKKLPPPSFSPDGSEKPFGHVSDEEKPALDATVVFNEGESSAGITGQTITATQTDKSAVLAKKNASAAVSKSTVSKKAGKTSNDGQSNFYGLNAAVVAQDGATLALKDVTVSSSADGANAVFSTGKGTLVTAKNLTIHTTKNSSRGLDATYGGTIRAEKVDILTEGEHCAAFATDRGEGTVSVNGGKAETRGEGSPVIYSTGDITVKNLTGKATGSEIACIEGKNSIKLEKAVLSGGVSRSTGGDVASGIMLYQSMSGDAHIGTASFTSSDSSLTSHASGPFFYVTNTSARISLSKTKLTNSASSVLLMASGNTSKRGWGKQGANGGTVSFSSINQTLEGNIIVDAISSISLDFGSGTKFSGAINASNMGTVNLKLSSKASLSLSADSFVNELDADTSFKNIKSNGHTLFYNKNASANSYLKGRTYLLSDGGKVCATDKITVSQVAASSGSDTPGAKDGSGAPGTFSKAKGKASAMMGKKLEFAAPAVVSYTGTIGENGSDVILQGSDGTTFVLTVMEFPGKGMPENGGMMPPPSGEMGMGGAGNGTQNGKPPAPPKGSTESFPPKGENGMKGAQGPKPVTLEELKALKGKTVQLEALSTPDGKLSVLRVKEEK